jgi:DNA ligase-associated metallophosphoesterase
MEIELRGERLLLDHRRALVWPRQSALLIADTHFGKSAVFRREGIALPEGSDAEDLHIISQLVADHAVSALYILGDFLHGALPSRHAFYQGFNAWRAARRGLEVHLILGNHDVYLDSSALQDVSYHSRLALDPFELAHEPRASGDDSYFLAGHIHPVARVSTRADSLRMPVFWQRPDGLVLPSFGTLTGGYAVRRARGETLYGVGPEAVTCLSTRPSA